MQKLNTGASPDAHPRNQRGSALVAVVAIIALVAIGSISLLELTGTTVNLETDMLRRARAFHAAESGAMLGAAWFKDTSGDGYSYVDTMTDSVMLFSAVEINNSFVDVLLMRDSVAGNTFFVDITARSFDDSVVRHDSTFITSVMYHHLYWDSASSFGMGTWSRLDTLPN